MELKTTNLTRSFGNLTAVNGINLSLHSGKVVGLVGPNGCGKTTLLLMLAGLLAPDFGEIRYNGKSPHQNGEQYRAQLGWMPDDFGLWNSLTCREILHFFGRAYGMEEQLTKRRTQDLLEYFDLAGKAEEPARILSRGQKQRLSLARAIIHSPRLLLLDEPANGLDPHYRIHLRQLLRDYAQQDNLVIVSSHILSELENLVDESIFMARGNQVPQPSSGQTLITWEIETLNPNTLVNWATHSGVSLKIDGNRAQVDVATETSAAQTLKSMVEFGVNVTHFRRLNSSLEDLFLQLDGELPPPVTKKTGDLQ